MKSVYHFGKVESETPFLALKEDGRRTMTGPPDGMWESFRANATKWGVYSNSELVGYGLVDTEQQLLEFYVDPRHLPFVLEIFAGLLEESGVKNGIVGTHQPVFLSTALHFSKHTSIHTYLFESHFDTELVERPEALNACTLKDLESIVDFGHYSVGAPKAWLRSYFGDLIRKEELFVLKQNDNIIGSCEVRQNSTAPAYSDVGMIVSPDFRRQGYGAYLLGSAKAIALARGKKPICSCEKDNTGSLRAIHANGFRTVHRLLAVSFSNSAL